MNNTFISWKRIIFAGSFLSAAMLAALYIFQVNSLVAMAYNVADQETQVRQLKEENKTLQTHAREALSLKDIEGLAAQLRFEKIHRITYLKVFEGPVAQNNNRQ